MRAKSLGVCVSVFKFLLKLLCGHQCLYLLFLIVVYINEAVCTVIMDGRS